MPNFAPVSTNSSSNDGWKLTVVRVTVHPIHRDGVLWAGAGRYMLPQYFMKAMFGELGGGRVHFFSLRRSLSGQGSDG
jgi:hypothetical protein